MIILMHQHNSALFPSCSHARTRHHFDAAYLLLMVYIVRTKFDSAWTGSAAHSRLEAFRLNNPVLPTHVCGRRTNEMKESGISVRACVRACVCVRVRVCVCARVRVCACVCVLAY